MGFAAKIPKCYKELIVFKIVVLDIFLLNLFVWVYYLILKIACSTGCSNCTNSLVTSCTNCSAGYILLNNSVCCPVSAPYLYLSTICVNVCPNNYYLD